MQLLTAPYKSVLFALKEQKQNVHLDSAALTAWGVQLRDKYLLIVLLFALIRVLVSVEARQCSV